MAATLAAISQEYIVPAPSNTPVITEDVKISNKSPDERTVYEYKGTLYRDIVSRQRAQLRDFLQTFGVEGQTIQILTDCLPHFLDTLTQKNGKKVYEASDGTLFFTSSDAHLHSEQTKVPQPTPLKTA